MSKSARFFGNAESRKIACKQALHTLGQLHSELAGKLLANAREARRPRISMLQVEAVMKMLDPAANIRL